MKTINWSDFRLKKLSEIKDGECYKVIGDGDMVFYAVVHPEQVMKDRVEGLCDLIDKSRGK